VPALWAEEGLTAALIMLIVLLVYQQVENNILTPKIQGKVVDLSGFTLAWIFGAVQHRLGVSSAMAGSTADP
jgi:predicted PurR-regulated permease PerM